MATLLYLYSKYAPVFLLVIILGGLTVSASASLCLPGIECAHGSCTSGITCQCDEGWTGVMCTDPVVNSSRTVSSPLEDVENRTKDTGGIFPLVGGDDGGGEVEENKECLPGFVCVNGVCKTGADIGCRCDSGWTGAFCEEPVSEGSSNTGSNQGSPSGTRFPPRSISPFTTPDTAVGKFKPEEGFGPLANFSLRLCITGFECRYGVCANSGYACICDPNWTGVFCHEYCPLNCGPNGMCRLEINPDNIGDISGYRCECNPSYTGTNCSEIRPIDAGSGPDDMTYWYAVGICGFLVTLLLISLLVVPYLLWRRGNITMLKLVFWFQGFEEDDGRLYDAFVSYASTEEDRQFVIESLIPVLENQMAFTLCIHERDFMPGKYITSNILESVRQSRRTLLVISPAFVSRNWCQFEFQTAVAEMIEKKHRILPVIMGDMQQMKQLSSMNETFKRLLNTVTYLQYPGNDASKEELERFWKRLELSMPKKSNHSPSSNPCSPAQTPTSITPLSLAVPSHQHQLKANGITFPTSSQIGSEVDAINIEPSPFSNLKDGQNQMSRKPQKGGFTAWVRKKFGRRKNSSQRHVYMNKYSTTLSPLHVTSKNNGVNVTSSNIYSRECVDKSEKLTNSNTNPTKGRSLHIELSGWNWPSSDAVQQTC